MIEVIGPAPSKSGRMVLARCSCGHEWTVPARRVPFMRSCGCAMKRKPRVKVALVDVPRLIPRPWRRSDHEVLGRIVRRCGVELWRLAYLPAMRLSEFRERSGLTHEDINRAVMRRWIESINVGGHTPIVMGVRSSWERMEALRAEILAPRVVRVVEQQSERKAA